MGLVDVAISVADYVMTRKDAFRVRDMMLFGSQARGTASPDNDVDLMIIHYNQGLERMQRRRNEPAADNFERLNRMNSELAREGCPGLLPLLDIAGVVEAISANHLNTEFIHEDFFTDMTYARMAILAQENPLFFHRAFSDGRLYNSVTGTFDVSALGQYVLLGITPEIIPDKLYKV